jgi:pathogenesis-related protein 1
MNQKHTQIQMIIFLFIAIIQLSSTNIETTKLTQIEKKEMLNAHNKWRSEVGVDSLRWSEELAASAQEWADKLAKNCNLKHSQTSNGENIYWNSTSTSALDVVNEWASEKSLYKNKKIGSDFYKYGHYTQLVWQNTKFAGGGKAKCKNGSEIWVCQYYPAGNIIGEYPYEVKK